MAIINDKPLSIGEILTKSIDLYLSSFIKILPLTIAFAIFVPFSTLALAKFTSSPELAVIPGEPVNHRHLITMLIFGAVFFLITLFLNSNMIFQVSKNINNELSSLTQGFKKVLNKFITIICAHIILIMMIAVLSLICYFIGKLTLTFIGIGVFAIITVILLVRFNFFIPLILFDNKAIVQSLRDSYDLTINFWWRTFLLTLIAALIHALFIMARQLVSQPIGFIVQFIETILVMPFILNILLLQFYDLKLRQAVSPTRKMSATNKLINNT